MIVNKIKIDMKELNLKDSIEITGGGFSYDVGCAWRYIGHFMYGYLGSGGPINPTATSSGYIIAEVTKCP
ncbi:hypothetical protein V8V91_21025 [Algoriphagus halophilus]|uniref:hypothetical protein n=1 Tax=Algoriphagus halophilus TaxID=226505 RepID=UPI00358F5ADC